ncbi:Membralin [Morella rubra]|uniref:Membralin n=1 Tax=Morella rubra TaxID=262757 RepID=A0A6A1V572_9ROSI|nr:Membralin [Morella rubra]
MDPEQTFIRVQERFSQMLRPKVRAVLEYFYLFVAITLFCILVVMHANYVQQPGCSSELSGVETTEAQLIQIKNESESIILDVLKCKTVIEKVESTNVGLVQINWIGSELAWKFWKADNELVENQEEPSLSSQISKPIVDDASKLIKRSDNFMAYYKCGHADACEHESPRVFGLGYFLLPEEAKSRHNIRTVNINISARHSCFGNRWQQLLINRIVGYDTILMNSLLSSPGQGYLYNYQTKEFYNLSYAREPPKGPARFGDYLVTKCGVLMMSLFVFFTTTMSVSFTLRETQTRMLKFTVQLQHHARHRLPTFQLIFVHVIESLVFVPIMIGILFFLFEFYDDQLLAFTVLILVWLSELFTLIRCRVSCFPKMVVLANVLQCPDANINEVLSSLLFALFPGFSYLALSTAAAFMQHLILYFWNRFEVPALQRFMQNRRSQLQQQPDFHITSSTILASTLHITRLNTRNSGPANNDLTSETGLRPGSDIAMPANGLDGSGLPEQPESENRAGDPIQIPGQPNLQQADNGPNPGNMNVFSSLLLWILGGASSEGLNSFLSMFRDVRDQGQVFAESPGQGNRENENLR